MLISKTLESFIYFFLDHDSGWNIVVILRHLNLFCLCQSSLLVPSVSANYIYRSSIDILSFFVLVQSYLAIEGNLKIADY